jgi:hypothetical protein
MKTYWGSGGIAPRILNRFTPGIHLTGGWVGSRTGSDAVAKKKIPASAGTRAPVVQHEAQSLYCLGYPSPLKLYLNVLYWREYLTKYKENNFSVHAVLSVTWLNFQQKFVSGSKLISEPVRHAKWGRRLWSKHFHLKDGTAVPLNQNTFQTRQEKALSPHSWTISMV